MLRKLVTSTPLVIFLVSMFIFTAFGQLTTGTLSGSVTDQDGAVVVGATVTARNTDTGAERTTVTNSTGVFVFTALQPGIYSASVDNEGFKKAVATNLRVSVGSETTATIALEIGEQTETVTVTAAQDVINTTTATLSNVIDIRQVKDLPLPTRNPLDLAALQAGIAVIGTDTRGASVGGLRQTGTNVTQDGINAMDNFVKTSSFFAISSPSLNSTAEFSITTGTTGSDQGRGVAQVNLVTKGGSNDFHGGIFYLHRNDAFNSNTFFNNSNNQPRSRQRQHFFGFDVGGPVYFLGLNEGGPKVFDGRDKAFFFLSYEGFRENFSATRNRTVLTPEARAGIFRYTGTNGALQSVNLLSIGTPRGINATTQALLATTPAPNNTLVGDGFNTAGYLYAVSGSDVNDKWVARYDHQLVKDSAIGSHKLEFVFNRATFSLSPDTFNGLEAPFPGAINAFQSSTRWLVTPALVSQFGSVTNVFRYGRQWAPVGFLRDSAAPKPYILFSGITNPENTFQSQGRETTVDQITNTMTVPKGNHLFSIGVDYQQVFADTFNDSGINQTISLGTNASNPNGLVQSQFPFGISADVTRAAAVWANITGNLASSAATFNVATPTSGFVAGQTRGRIFKARDVALFMSDQWRFRPNLTLNLGVRWEYLGVPTIPNGLAIQPTNAFDIYGISGPGNLFNPNAPAGFSPARATLDFVSGKTGKALYKDDWNNFAPFVGFAYSPDFKNSALKALFGEAGKSSIRMGYSISYLKDGFTVISNALGTGTTNPGLIQTAANNTPTGALTGAGVPLTTPTFTIPITDRANYLINSTNGLWSIDPNLKIPYVQQWSVGFEREILPKMALEVRYVGNHAVKVWRAIDVNEVNIFENGFLQEFLGAQSNYNIYLAANPNCAAAGGVGNPCRFGNSGLAGQVTLPRMSAFFTGLAATSTSGFASSAFISNLQNNNVGTFASTLAFSNTYRTARENAANGIPANFFVANPNAAFARILGNDSMSNYHSLQVVLRRRFSDGFQFQADYTMSKSLTDAPAALGNNQSDLTSFRTQRNKSLDYMNSSQDQKHRFVANGIYELPFGKGRGLFSGANGFVDKLINDWTIGSIVTWATRPPFFIASGRTTFNNFNSGNNPAQLLGISFAEFKKNLGVFKTPAGVFFINPNLLNITTNPVTGRYVSSTLKPGLIGVSAPGTFGNFPMNSLSGPNFFNLDMSVTKRLKFKERYSFELKTTMINILNHPSFIFNTQNFDSTSFGLINSTSGSARIVHFTGSFRF